MCACHNTHIHIVYTQTPHTGQHCACVHAKRQHNTHIHIVYTQTPHTGQHCACVHAKRQHNTHIHIVHYVYVRESVLSPVPLQEAVFDCPLMAVPDATLSAAPGGVNALVSLSAQGTSSTLGASLVGGVLGGEVLQ